MLPILMTVIVLSTARLILFLAINLNGSYNNYWNLASLVATAESNNDEIVKVQPI